MPEKVKELEAKLDAYLKAIKAPMARVNPDAGKTPAEGEKPAAEGEKGQSPDGARPGGGQRRGGQGGGGGRRGGQGGGGNQQPGGGA
jgi:hypothetical protein